MNPLPFPETPSGIARILLDIERVDFAAPEASGRQGGVQAGWPLWTGILEIDRVDPDSADLFRAFLDRLRGRQRTFLVYNTARPYTKAKPGGFAGMTKAGGGAFTGSATTWSQTVDADGNATFNLTGLPANFELNAGDMLGFKWDAAGATAGSYGRRTMARVCSAASASAGGVVSVMAEPPIDPLVVPAGAIAHFDMASFVARQIPEKTNLGPIGGGGAMGGGTITVIQDLRA